MTETALTISETNDLSNRLQDNPAAVYLASLSSRLSRTTMHGTLNKIAEIISSGQHNAESLQWGALRYQHTQAIRAALAEQYKPASTNKMLSALRGVIEKAYKLGYMTPDEYAKASDIKGTSDADPAGREFDRGELTALANICKGDKTAAGARDAAIIGLAYACGLRRSELVALELADYDHTNGRIVIRLGKGRKTRTVYAKSGANAALQACLNWRGLEAGPLFTRVGKGDKQTMSKLTTQAVYVILRKRASQAGGKRFSPHDMRRTYAGDMLQGGADITTVAKLMGHASVITTARYDRRAEETKEKAAGIVHFPF